MHKDHSCKVLNLHFLIFLDYMIRFVGYRSVFTIKKMMKYRIELYKNNISLNSALPMCIMVKQTCLHRQKTSFFYIW